MAARFADIVERRAKTLLKDIWYLPLDALDSLLGKRDEMTPPRRMIFVGDGDFRKTGEEFLGYFVNLAGLEEGDRVLDIGCGIGRMAIPLTQYLRTGAYEGIDIVPRGIEWCSKKISTRYPNFHFQLADVYNKWYNPSGSCNASEYRFPFPDRSFDFIFLTSVFTHMLPADLENYFSEIGRTLAVNGRMLATYFLLNEDSQTLLREGRSTLDFRYDRPGYMTISESKPESATAYMEEYVRSLYVKHGLRIIEPIRSGSWCGRTEFLSYQDVVICEKG